MKTLILLALAAIMGACAMMPPAPSVVTVTVPNVTPELAISRLAASFAKGAVAGIVVVSVTPTQLVIEKPADREVTAFSRSTGNLMSDRPTGRMTFTAIQDGANTLLSLHAQTIHFPGSPMQEIEEANDRALTDVAQGAARIAGN